jgi:glycine reductase complex component B subunit alpha and beta
VNPDPGFQLARYDVDEVVESDASRWIDGRLELDLAGLKEAVAGVSGALDDVSLRVVRPGDPVRVANVLDAVVPDVRADGAADTFPGALGGLSPAGRGRTNRLGGVHVLSVCDWLRAGYTTAEEFPDGLVDMAGPAQDLTAFGTTVDLVADCRPREGVPVGDVDRAVRRVSLTLARELAAATLGHEETRRDAFAAPPADPDLPGVVLVLQVASEGPLVDTFLYGEAVGGIVPTQVAPCEILDGALTSGAYDWAGVRNPTAFYQENAAIQDLFAAHGSRLRFLGVILALGYLDSVFAKQRSAMLSARLASDLGADAAICTTFSSGNSHTDTMLTVRACESMGVRTVALVAETNGGLTDHVPEADCIVSTGNEDELVDGWAPDEVIGARTAVRAGEPVPLWAYVGAVSQTGNLYRTAVPA